MKATRNLLSLLALVALLATGSALAAQQTDLAQPEPLATLLAQDWEMVAPAVLQRIEPNGELVTLVIGSEGYAWQLRQMEARLEVLERRAEVVDTAELRQAIRDQRDLVARLTLKVEEAREEGWGLQGLSLEGLDPILELLIGCNSSVNASASAGPTSTGPKGTGSASFSDGCSAYGETAATAYADGRLNGVYTSCYQTHPNDGYGFASSYATCTVNADTNCYSYAYGWAEIPGVGDITRNDSDYTCRPPEPVVATMSGVTFAYVPAYDCQTLVWTASATGGTGTYTYEWRYNGLLVRTGSSYSRTYCSNGINTLYITDSVSVTATDTGGMSDTDSRSIHVTLAGECDPIQPYSATVNGDDGNVVGFKLPIQPCLE